MAHVIRQPCDEWVICSTEAQSVCTPDAAPWVLAATILGSSMAFIDETALPVALPATALASALSAALLIEGKRPERSGRQPVVEGEVASDPLEP